MTNNYLILVRIPSDNWSHLKLVVNGLISHNMIRGLNIKCNTLSKVCIAFGDGKSINPRKLQIDMVTAKQFISQILFISYDPA